MMSRRITSLCALLCCNVALAQSAYTPPRAYGSSGTAGSTSASSPSSSVVVNNANNAGHKPSQQAPVPLPVDMPGMAGRPNPSAPMPTPLPPIDNVQRALDQSAPLTPEEIFRLMRELSDRSRAGQQNVTGSPPAKPVTSVETLDLSPNAAPPVIRVAMGQGAVLTFSDAAGRPWPIADDQNFNGRAYSVKLLGPNIYSVTLLGREPANLTIILKGLNRPIVITANPATDETDYLKQYTVPSFIDGLPPASVAASSREGTVSFNSPELIDYLYRTPPKTARALTVSGLPGVMAWQIDSGRIVVRTAGQVVIPAFSRRHSGNDGVTVFELPLSPVVSITEGGALNRVSIGGYVVDTSASTTVAPVTAK